MAVCHVPHARPEGSTPNGHTPNTRPEGGLRVCQAFNARPEGATSSQPRASERSEQHPGLGWRVSDTPPEGAKAATEMFKSNERGVKLHRVGVQIERTRYSNQTNGTFNYTGWAFKSNDYSLLSLLLPPPGAYRKPICLTQGVARCARLPWAGSLAPRRGVP